MLEAKKCWTRSLYKKPEIRNPATEIHRENQGTIEAELDKKVAQLHRIAEEIDRLRSRSSKNFQGLEEAASIAIQTSFELQNYEPDQPLQEERNAPMYRPNVGDSAAQASTKFTKTSMRKRGKEDIKKGLWDHGFRDERTTLQLVDRTSRLLQVE